jgi:hypothetical protein
MLFHKHAKDLEQDLKLEHYLWILFSRLNELLNVIPLWMLIGGKVLELSRLLKLVYFFLKVNKLLLLELQ